MWLSQIFIAFKDGSGVAFVLHPNQDRVSVVNADATGENTSTFQLSQKDAIILLFRSHNIGAKVDIFKSVTGEDHE
jgi:hypothetical protein